MNWNRIESDWVQFTGNTGNVNERWDHLIDQQLSDRVIDTYGLTNGDDNAHCELSDWELRVMEIERAAH